MNEFDVAIDIGGSPSDFCKGFGCPLLAGRSKESLPRNGKWVCCIKAWTTDKPMPWGYTVGKKQHLTTADRMGKNWAIAIGINRYRNLQALDYAKRDAEAMRDYLGERLSCREIFYFSDDSPPIRQDYGPPLNSQPTYATMRRFLRTRFEEAFLQPGDNLWFFFAGHGRRHDDRDYLIPIDADPGDIEHTAIPLHYVTERLQRCGADNVILFVDACRSKTGRRDGLGIGRERQKGVITFFSCQPEESSYEIEPLQHGSFTYALLESLKIQGEGNCATVERLYDRLCRKVPELNQRYKKPIQTPYGCIEPPTKNQLILLPQQATLSDVLALKNSAMAAELRSDRALAKQFWIRVLAVSPADLDAVEGIERLARVAASPPAPEPEPLPEPSPSRGAIALPTVRFEMVTVDDRGRERDRQQGSGEYWREDVGKGVVLDLMKIPAGEFLMGSPDGEEGRDWYAKFNESLTNVEGPQHRVTVSAFCLGKYAVTQAQWRIVAGFPKVEQDLNPDPSKFKGENRPVEQVSWDDAMEFCARLSEQTGQTYRLPSEAEWEYACRAGTTTPFHFGPTITTDIANYDGTDGEYEGKTYSGNYGRGPKGKFRQETTEVGSFGIANGCGLYDMHGNVFEWCLDPWHPNHEGAPKDSRAWIDESDNDNQIRLLRGGSWYVGPGDCRSASRYFNSRDNRSNDFGFRVCCVPPGSLLSP